jgi:hypothetical protein
VFNFASDDATFSCHETTMKQKITPFLFLTFSLIISACSPIATQTQIPPTGTNIPVQAQPTWTATPTATPTPLPLLITINEQANCYGGPDKDGYALIAVFEKGEQVDLVGKNTSGKYWIVIDHKSNKGCWVESQYTVAQGAINTLPILIPAPTVSSRPSPPENLVVSFKCTKIHHQGSLISWQTFLTTITITWSDTSNNEKGFEISRNGNPWRTFEANTTQTSEDIESKLAMYGDISYSVFAFNDAGKSLRVEKVLTYHCP